MMFWMCAIVIAVVSYLIGGVNGAIVASKFIFRKDVREYGSKNAGLTNFYRVFGAKGALLVLAIDILKAAVCSILSGIIFVKFGRSAEFGRLCSGLFVVAGHVWPLFYEFKGGKGVLSTEVIALVVDWRIGVAALCVFLIIVITTRYVSLGSVLGGLSLPFTAAIIGYPAYVVVMTAIFTALVAAKHTENIIRLLRGKESKFAFKKK